MTSLPHGFWGQMPDIVDFAMSSFFRSFLHSIELAAMLQYLFKFLQYLYCMYFFFFFFCFARRPSSHSIHNAGFCSCFWGFIYVRYSIQEEMKNKQKKNRKANRFIWNEFRHEFVGRHNSYIAGRWLSEWNNDEKKITL